MPYHHNPYIIICTSFISSIDYTVFIVLQCHLKDHLCREWRKAMIYYYYLVVFMINPCGRDVNIPGYLLPKGIPPFMFTKIPRHEWFSTYFLPLYVICIAFTAIICIIHIVSGPHLFITKHCALWLTLAPGETGFSHRLTAYKIVGHFFGRS